MEIIVPKEVDGLALIENNLDKLSVNEDNRYFKHEIILALPKFKVETTIDLKPHLVQVLNNNNKATLVTCYLNFSQICR